MPHIQLLKEFAFIYSLFTCSLYLSNILCWSSPISGIGLCLFHLCSPCWFVLFLLCFLAMLFHLFLFTVLWIVSQCTLCHTFGIKIWYLCWYLPPFGVGGEYTTVSTVMSTLCKCGRYRSLLILNISQIFTWWNIF